KNCGASPASLFFCRCTALRPQARRPQLKRDPLGRTNWRRHMRRCRSVAFALSLAAPIIAQGQATVPGQFRGKWAGSQAKCHVPSESSLAIYADRIDFYESRGRVLAVKVVG